MSVMRHERYCVRRQSVIFTARDLLHMLAGADYPYAQWRTK
jgi:hypothetical protein